MPKPAKNLIWLLTGLSGLGLLVMVFCILSGMEYLFFSLAPLFAVVHAVIPAISLFFLGSQRSPGSPIIVAFLQFTMLLFVFGAAMEGFSELYFPFASGLGVILMVLYLLGCLVAMILALLTSTRQWYAGMDAPSSGQAGQQTSHDQGFYTDFPQNNGLGGAYPQGGTGNAGNAGNAADQGFKANPNSAPGSAPGSASGNPTNNSF
ncbi:hypothetical protein GP475_00830 [Corynebacterium poyangense]|uniref:Uncharacterized protein n=1 Tax=Corynebacterium poyangense TaxID=2684405 RepID=A0A7H0SLB3_9CORY|nr:hypothetical protein [Corynebacterium poyangense]QNQ89338.1 hypothetical protein GP475_00830 [Corynebacterium poyangense]